MKGYPNDAIKYVTYEQEWGVMLDGASRARIITANFSSLLLFSLGVVLCTNYILAIGPIILFTKNTKKHFLD